MYAYVHAFIHTCMHAYMHTYIYTYIHTGSSTDLESKANFVSLSPIKFIWFTFYRKNNFIYRTCMRNSSSHAYTLSCPSKEEALALQGTICFSFHFISFHYKTSSLEIRLNSKKKKIATVYRCAHQKQNSRMLLNE